MWPKALTQLVELAPHVTRLLPLADRYFKDKATGDESTAKVMEGHRAALDAQRAAVTDLSDRLHADLGAITSQQTTQLAAFARHLGELEKSLVTVSASATAARQAADAVDGRLNRLEASQRRGQALTLTGIVLTAIILVLLLVLLLRAH